MADDELSEIKFVLGTLVNSLTVREENLIGHKDYQRIKSIVGKWEEPEAIYKKLGPCPYCGNEWPELYQGLDGMFFARCRDPFCNKILVPGRTRDECMKLWNKNREVIINEHRSEQERTSPDKKSPGD